jgi:hypothetical protein
LMEWLTAVSELLKWYKEGVGNPHPCNLCRIAYTRGGDSGHCMACLWVKFEGVTCMEFYHKLFGMELMNLGYFIMKAKAERLEQLTYARVPMLEEWKRVLTMALKRRFKNVGSTSVEKV